MIVDNLIITWRYTQETFPVGKKTVAHGEKAGKRVVCVEKTTCKVLNKETKELVFEASVGCNSLDPYDKETGRRKSLTDAIDRLPRETRSKIWEAYRTLGKTPRW